MSTETKPQPDSLANIVKIALDGWNAYYKRATDLIDGLTDEQLKQQIAPGKNTGTYLLGHITAVNDAMLPLLGLGDRLYPELTAVFITAPDNTGQTFPTVAELKAKWTHVRQKLSEAFGQLTPGEWLEKHTAVSAEDFAKEPHRNRLSVLMSRTQHLSYHFGQLVYLKGR